MQFERITLLDIIYIAAIAAIFYFFGESVGWRAVGVFMSIYAIKIFREKKVAAGIEGFEPSFYITGFGAKLIGILAVIISITLLFFPEQTVMSWFKHR